MKKTFLMSALACGVGVFLGLSNAAATTNVDLELVLAVDVSGSIDTGEYNLQKQGYADAFNNAATIAKIMSGGTYHSIAVKMVEWSGASEQRTVVDWTLISNAAQSQAFATAVNGISRFYSGVTAPGSALNYITPMFATNDYIGTRKVIDVSGDGSQNSGANTLAARNAALAAGIDQINGLAIIDDELNLKTWYENNIMGGTGAFVIAAAN